MHFQLISIDKHAKKIHDSFIINLSLFELSTYTQLSITLFQLCAWLFFTLKYGAVDEKNGIPKFKILSKIQIIAVATLNFV